MTREFQSFSFIILRWPKRTDGRLASACCQNSHLRMRSNIINGVAVFDSLREVPRHGAFPTRRRSRPGLNEMPLFLLFSFKWEFVRSFAIVGYRVVVVWTSRFFSFTATVLPVFPSDFFSTAFRCEVAAFRRVFAVPVRCLFLSVLSRCPSPNTPHRWTRPFLPQVSPVDLWSRKARGTLFAGTCLKWTEPKSRPPPS